MFKRIAKRQRKREKEEELGLDEEIKQVLGLQDTDSDESLDSSSDSDSGNDSDLGSISGEESDDEETDHIRPAPNTSLKRKRSAAGLHAQSDSDGSPGEGELSDLEGPDTDSSEDDMDDDDGPPMDVMSATTNPIYDVPSAPSTQDIRACVVCPGKLLKNTKMAKVHVESTAHLRRLQRYTAHVSKLASSPEGLTTDDPRDILRDMSGATSSEAPVKDTSSKRSQRRDLWKAKQAERKKVRNQTKAKNTTDKPKETDHAVVGDKERRVRGAKPKKSGQKAANDAEAIAVSMAVDSPSTRKPQEGKAETKARSEPDSDATTRPRQKKRLKQEVQTDTSSQTDIKDPPGSKPHPIKVDRRPQDGKRATAPKLKRQNTSLYFADDEKVPSAASPPKSPPRSKKPGKHNPADGGARERKTVTFASGTKHQPNSRRTDQDGGSSTPVRTPNRRARRESINRGKSQDEGEGQRERAASGGKGKGKGVLTGQGLSAKQWGGGEVLQIFD